MKVNKNGWVFKLNSKCFDEVAYLGGYNKINSCTYAALSIISVLAVLVGLAIGSLVGLIVLSYLMLISGSLTGYFGFSEGFTALAVLFSVVIAPILTVVYSIPYAKDFGFMPRYMKAPFTKAYDRVPCSVKHTTRRVLSFITSRVSSLKSKICTEVTFKGE